MERHRTQILLSGGFDPIHVGHIRMFKAAYEFVRPNGMVIVAVNTDEWLMRKKGFVFMPFSERAEIIASIGWVGKVLRAIDADDTVCETIRLMKPDYFGNGGDRKDDNTPEVELCRIMQVQLVWNLGGW